MNAATEDQWPSITVQGYGIFRTAYNHAFFAEEERGLRWELQPGFVGMGNKDTTCAVLGELTVRTARRFAGVHVWALLRVQGLESLGEADWPTANEILKDNADWLTHGLYDYAAVVMRGVTADGDDGAIRIPVATPPHTLVFVTADDASTDDLPDDPYDA